MKIETFFEFLDFANDFATPRKGERDYNSWNSCLIYGKRYPCENIKEFQIN